MSVSVFGLALNATTTILLNDILFLFFSSSGAQHSLPVESTAQHSGALHSVIRGRQRQRQRRRRPAEPVGPWADTCPAPHRKVHEGRLRSACGRHTTNSSRTKVATPSLGLDPATQGELNMLPRPSPPTAESAKGRGGGIGSQGQGCLDLALSSIRPRWLVQVQLSMPTKPRT